MIDANQRWDVAEAISWVTSLAEFKPLWIEEPTSPDDILGHAAISKVREKFDCKPVNPWAQTGKTSETLNLMTWCSTMFHFEANVLLSKHCRQAVRPPQITRGNTCHAFHTQCNRKNEKLNDLFSCLFSVPIYNVLCLVVSPSARPQGALIHLSVFYLYLQTPNKERLFSHSCFY